MKVGLRVAVASIVPVKAPTISKKRLATVLSPQERAALTISMLKDVLRALKFSRVSQTVVVSSDFTIQQVADKFKAKYLPENQAGLNQALEQATQWLETHHVDSVLIIPSDVPLVSPEDIAQIINLAVDEKSVVLSSSQDGGTNALLKRPPNLVPACFGPNSFKRHIREARASGVEPKIYYSPRINMDIDSVEDLRSFFHVRSDTMSRRFLTQDALCHMFM